MPITRLKAARFQTKVLVPVVLVMVSLVAVTMVVVNHRLTSQFHHEAGQALQTAESVFKLSQKEHQKSRLVELRSIPSAPKYRATLLTGDAATITEMLEKNTIEIPGEFVAYTTVEGKSLATSRRDSTLDLAEFERNAEPVIKQAMEGAPAVDTIRVSDVLFDVASLPVTLPNGQMLGVLTFCSKFGEADTVTCY